MKLDFNDGRANIKRPKISNRHLLSVEQLIEELRKIGPVPAGGAGAIKKDLEQYKNMHMVEYRYKNDFSQDRAAALAGISKGLWAGLENNSRIPTEKEADKISTLLNKTVFTTTRKALPNPRMAFKSDSKLAMIRLLHGKTQIELARMIFNVDDTLSVSYIQKFIAKIESFKPIAQEDAYLLQIIANLFNKSVIEVVG